MSLCDNLNITFARDVAGLVNDIFCKYHFNRMEWICVSQYTINSFNTLMFVSNNSTAMFFHKTFYNF